MSSQRPSPPTLVIPDNSRSPGGNSPTSLTGRPPLWTRSTQRKMSRLYLYTTLPISKILELIYIDSPHAAPGKDSANKKLNAMLDKEPRWLHPKTSVDMDRRVTELSNSPTRSPRASNSSAGRPHSVSDPMPYHASASEFNVELATRPSTRNVSPFDEWPIPSPNATLSARGLSYGTPTFPTGSAQTSRGSTASPDAGLGLDQGDLFGKFLRQTTFMSSSTDQTTGSFHRVLDGYSEPYIKTVRRLVKRFTMSHHGNNNNNRQSISPIAERPEMFQKSWVDDDDAPSVYRERPYPLPGDYLNLPTSLQQPHNQSSFCLPVSPWIESMAITPEGHRVLSLNLTSSDILARDDFGNTILHFMVARGTIDIVLHVLEMGFCNPIINEKNSAGQTFLHLISASWLRNDYYLHKLIEVLFRCQFDFYARDHYGRNVFHILRQEDIDSTNILQHLDRARYAKRDAFNIVPAANPNTGYSMDIDSSISQQFFESSPEFDAVEGMISDSKLLRYVRLCHDDPSLEDEDGRNGLHCLAMVSLSFRHVENRSNVSLHLPTPEHPRRRSQGVDEFDSSEALLQKRHEYVEGLLAHRVDPNHYDHQGNTPLMAFAAELPEDDDYKIGPKILETLLDNGAEINARNRAGETALHIAVRCGRKLAVRTLVKRGANVFARDAAGRSVLDVADVKMANLRDDDPRAYSHFEACRAWLSGAGHAVQQPSPLQEWSTTSRGL